MHRSGTSAFAGALSMLGVAFGRDLMKSWKDNSKGYYESWNIYHLNESLLKAIDSSWDSTLPIRPESLNKNDLYLYKERLKYIIREEFDHDKLMGIKDPRICRLLPFWSEVLDEMGISCRFILPIRNPLEVADSLRKRDGFSFEKSIILWMEHVINAELFSRGKRRVIALFDDLISQPERTIRSLVSDLNIELTENIDDVMDNIRDFIKHDNKHFNISINENVSRLPECVLQYYKTISDPDFRADDRKNHEKLDLLAGEYERMRDLSGKSKACRQRSLIRGVSNCINMEKGDKEGQLGMGWISSEGEYRWMSRNADVFLKCPHPKRLRHKVFMSGSASLKYLQKRELNMQILMENKVIYRTMFKNEGDFKISFNVNETIPELCRLVIKLDQAFLPSEVKRNEDNRELGLQIKEIKLD